MNQSFTLLTWFHLALDIIPIFLGMLLIFRSASAFKVVKSSKRKLFIIGTFICALLLVFAQLSWWINLFTVGIKPDTVVTDLLWLLLNSLTMFLLLLTTEECRNETTEFLPR